jgi:hypothetical protein
VYVLAEPEGPAVDVTEDAHGPFEFDDCLYLEVGVEVGDAAATVVTVAARRVHRICRMTKPKTVVINAVAGLATEAHRAGPEEALVATQRLEARLLERGYQVHRQPFGWTKTILEQSVAAGTWQQRTFEITPTVAAGELARPIRTPDGLLTSAAAASPL